MNGKEVYLGLGTNLGNKFENLRQCLLYLTECEELKLIEMSSIYESPSWGFESFPFYNMVVRLQTTLSPDELLSFINSIEMLMGRNKKTSEKNYQARIIDIDILFYGNESIVNNHLIIPHPEINNRDFVVIPLLEIIQDADVSLIQLETKKLKIKKNNLNLLKIESSKLRECIQD